MDFGSLIEKVARKISYEFRKEVLKDPRLVSHRRWVKDSGETTLRVNYPLTESSVVVDLGGYKGEWAEQMYSKYNSKIDVFEPVDTFFQGIVAKFQAIPSVTAFPFGLSDTNEIVQFNLMDNGSSAMHSISGSAQVSVKMRDVCEVFSENKYSQIDLLKINIEGGEYQVLQRILESGLVSNIKYFQIQFHDFVQDAEKKRNDIRTRLADTHSLTYDYPFVWEGWERKSS